MIRTNGLRTKYKPIEVVSEVDNIYIIRWDYAEVKEIDQKTKELIDTDLAIWAEEILYHKPTEAELRKLFTKYYNDITDNKILSGFVWNDMQIWLSDENQRNYKAVYDLAVQKNGANLPAEFKFGTDTQPVYQVFHTVEELEAFYLPAIAYVQQCLSEGWRMKDAIDYSLYSTDLRGSSE